jgi:two-component system sensor histidine kinase/response regulator
MARILVVDDEPNIRLGLSRILATAAHDVAEAGDGKIGIEMVQLWRPDIVLTDINMGPTNGFELVQKVRSDPQNISTRVVLMTGENDLERFREAMNLGADDYLAKPFNKETLLRCIATQISKQQIYRAEVQKSVRRITAVLPQELKRPMLSVLASAEKLATPAADATVQNLQESAATLLTSIKELQRGVENSLLFTQIESFLDSPERWAAEGRCFYAKHVVEAIAQSEAVAVGRLADLELLLADIAVKINPELLQKLVHEILRNAFKFSKPGTPVRLGMIRRENYCEISIEDFGEGMSPEQIDKIEAASQFDRATAAQPGMGLGIYLAKRLAQIHAGTFQIKSVPKSGTTVQITLPLDEFS